MRIASLFIALALGAIPRSAIADDGTDSNATSAAPSSDSDAKPASPSIGPTNADASTPSEMGALQKQVADLSAKLAAHQVELARQKLLLIPQKDLEYDLDGYYRFRTYNFRGLTPRVEGEPNARFGAMRLRMQPKITYKNLAKFFFQVDALDDVVLGDNASQASTALFAEQPSYTGFNGQSRPSIMLSRAWLDVTTPLGTLRAGRMTSHWGLGLLANGGDGFDDLFGENHGGATFDRVMFATRPIALAQAFTGKKDSDIPLFAAVGVDRVVEDPLFQYHGFKCKTGLATGDRDFDARCDTDGDGVTDTEHPIVDETRQTGDRRDDWWMDSADDVRQMVYVLVYRGEDVRYLGAKGDLTAGAYVVHRSQRETDSDVWISDTYINAKNRGVHLEFEGLTIKGHTRAITLPGAYDPSGQTDDPLYKTANIWSYVGRLGYERSNWNATFETGYASGDNNIADGEFTGRSIHSDYNVGILLYEEVISRVTAAGWSTGAAGLWSNGGVYNSRYIYPNVTFEPIDNWKIVGAFLLATPDKADGAIIRCAQGDAVDCAAYEATSSILGTEFDLGLKITFHKHVNFSLESAWARATDRLPLETAGLDPSGKFFTLQSRIAYEF